MPEQSVVELIESSWEKVEAHITLEEVMESFLTQGLDQCGAKMCLAAFKLVSRALDQGGYVRRVHKSENSNMSGVLLEPEGPWLEQDKILTQQWDYQGTWMSSIPLIVKNAPRSDKDWQKYIALDPTAVLENFCEPLEHNWNLENPDNGVALAQPWGTSTSEDGDAFEPYWIFDMQKKTEWLSTDLVKYGYNLKVCPIQRPDLVMQIAYTCPKHYLQKKIVVMVEIDGHDKTLQASNAACMNPEKILIPPAKLALKAMQSTSVQAVLQPHTYNIRSNFYSYLKNVVDRSLFTTTNVELCSFRDILNRLSTCTQHDTGLDDFHQLTRTIHVVWHMYKAHIKVAFLIYMREVHGIDIRDGLNAQRVKKNDSDRMQDHHFFVNFTGISLPNEIKFADRAPRPVQDFLKERMMQQSLVKIKVCDTLVSKKNFRALQTKWVEAPIMSTTHRSKMTEWSARVSSGLLPMFPKEDSTSVPVSYATVQRVDIKKLCQLVKNAAYKAFEAYDKSRTISEKNDGLVRRDFPDRCYLTRNAQLDENEWWNKQLCLPSNDKKIHDREKCLYNAPREPGIAVNKRPNLTEKQLVELNFGYEAPSMKRDYNIKPNDIGCCTFDQVDVRMYFFSQMIANDWKESANGMWYVEDYVQFFKMLQTLEVPPKCRDHTAEKNKFTCEVKQKEGESSKDYLSKSQESIKYRLRLHNSNNRLKTIMKDPTLIDLFWQSSSDPENFTIPVQNDNEDLAYHIFSVLSFFFDCRDDGACKYQWENWLLNYFGASLEKDALSEFHNFKFSDTKDAQYKYFNDTWFQMCFFLENNFRNAISALHYKLFDISDKAHLGEFSHLQAAAKKVYNREKSLLNNRSSFAGLGNVSAGLSFRKYNSKNNGNLTLRHRILSQMDDELPDLDPALTAYVRKFRIPDSELFLRMIRCPNILALRELAKQHLSPEPLKQMQMVLDYFDPAIQSEIEMMLKFVQTDESVYVHAPEAHPSKRMLLTESQMLKWMRQTVQCTSFASSLGMLSNVTPLQCKYDMFLNPTSFHVLQNFFCTRQLINFGCQRPLKFILLQLALVDGILKCENVTDIEHANDSFLVAGIEDHDSEQFITPVGLKIGIQYENKHECVPCVIGTSRRGWPQRDLNKVSNIKNSIILRKNEERDDTPSTNVHPVRSFFDKNELCISDKKKQKFHFLGDTCDELEMTDDELRLWMLLAYARPCSKPKYEINVSITQEVSLENITQKRDCEDVALDYQEQFKEGKRVLSCCIHRVEDHIFFERCEKSSVHGEQFPPYIKALIPENIDRKLIYVPTACAAMLRRQKRPAFFTHSVCGDIYKWRPVFSGLRTWCWKRLLVKTIFLHSFGKIATRSNIILSLYKNVQTMTNTEILNLLREANTATMDKIGDLSYKEKWLPKDCNKKMSVQQHQAVLISLHEYQARQWSPGSTFTLNVHKCLKYTSSQKQMHWLKYLEDHIETLRTTKSCRFLRIDKRLEEPFLKMNHNMSAHTPAVTQSFFVYRDYLYFQQEIQLLVVNVNNTYYVKFPHMFGIRLYNDKNENTTKICVCKVTEDTLVPKKFFTSLDTRRCSWFHKVHQDTEDDMQLIQEYKKMKLKGLSVDVKTWRTVSDQFHDGMQWACFTDVDTKQYLDKLTPAYTFSNISATSCLFTMPDFYIQDLTEAAVRRLYQSRRSKNQKDIQVCEFLQRILLYKPWLPLKADSRFLQVRDSDKKSSAIHELENKYENPFLEEIMSQISKNLTPSSSEHIQD